MVSTVQLLYTVKEKGGKPDRKPFPLPYGFKNSQDYGQKPPRNCTFMNSPYKTVTMFTFHIASHSC